MKNSGSFLKTEEVPNLAIGYINDMQPGQNTEIKRNTDTLPSKGSSAGGGYSTAEDMLNFINALKNDVLLENTFSEIFFNAIPNIPGATDYGFGVGEFSSNRNVAIGHNGGAPGISAHYETYLNSGYSVVVIANLGDSRQPLSEIRRQISPKEALVVGYDNKIYINDKAFATYVQPTIIDEITYLPFDEVAFAFGCRIMIGGQITLSKDDLRAVFEIGSAKVIVNDTEVVLSSAIKNINGVQMIPVDFVSKVFGYDVHVVDGIVYINTVK